MTEDDRPLRIMADKIIKMQGSSLVIIITPEARALGLDIGDIVRVTLERIDE
jgi:hypothetical protein